MINADWYVDLTPPPEQVHKYTNNHLGFVAPSRCTLSQSLCVSCLLNAQVSQLSLLSAKKKLEPHKTVQDPPKP